MTFIISFFFFKCVLGSPLTFIFNLRATQKVHLTAITVKRALPKGRPFQQYL